jgi:hypothetical protein
VFPTLCRGFLTIVIVEECRRLGCDIGRHIPEDGILPSHRLGNLESYVVIVLGIFGSPAQISFGECRVAIADKSRRDSSPWCMQLPWCCVLAEFAMATVMSVIVSRRLQHFGESCRLFHFAPLVLAVTVTCSVIRMYWFLLSCCLLFNAHYTTSYEKKVLRLMTIRIWNEILMVCLQCEAFGIDRPNKIRRKP